MRLLYALSLLLALAVCAFPQAQRKSAMTPAVPPSSTQAGGSGPSKATVESFMRHMFGYNPNLKWQVLSIRPSEELPGFSEVVIGIGQQLAKLYITPDGRHAIQGEVMPFGADPFADTRKKLEKASGPERGPAGASVTIVEFSDLECPHCAKAQPVLEKLLADEPNARVIYEPYPLPQHKWAGQAARFALCVNRQDKPAFWKFVDSVYASQLSIDETNADAKLTQLAADAGANGQQVAACSATPAVRKQVEDSINLGNEVGVTGTPTFFINGRKVQDIVDTPYEQVKAVVDFAAQQSAASR